MQHGSQNKMKFITLIGWELTNNKEWNWQPKWKLAKLLEHTTLDIIEFIEPSGKRRRFLSCCHWESGEVWLGHLEPVTDDDRTDAANFLGETGKDAPPRVLVLLDATDEALAMEAKMEEEED